MSTLKQNPWTPIVAGVLFGALYGIAGRWLIHDPGHHRSAVVSTFAGVSIAYLFLVPFGLGVLSASMAPPGIRRPWLYWLFMPWLSVLVMLIVVMALAWEGLICLLMAAPIVLFMAMLGGITVATVVTIRRRRRAPPAFVASCLVLPFAWGPAEARLAPTDDLRTVTTIADIDADVGTVWRNVVRVPLIKDEEQSVGLFQKVGIPRPLEATVIGEGVGALRQARFSEEIRFDEHVTAWEVGRRLGFTITVDPSSIPPSVLDVHVRVGGPYFDVVYGEFTLEPHGSGTRLHLESRHHLKTHLNFYAHYWTDAVMRDIQANICHVIKTRAESSSHRP
jgi:hypothetical protein